MVTWLSEAYLLAGRLEEERQAAPEIELVASHYRQALALTKELEMCPLVAHCHHRMAV